MYFWLFVNYEKQFSEMNSIYKSNVPFNVNKNTNKKATLERYAKFLDWWHGNKTPISAFLCGEKTTLINVIQSAYHQMASSFERQKHHMRWKPWKTRFWFNTRKVSPIFKPNRHCLVRVFCLWLSLSRSHLRAHVFPTKFRNFLVTINNRRVKTDYLWGVVEG